jgi:hypothetical protein
MANNFPNLLPALNIDMVNGIYVDPRVTFTRAGTRTYYGQEVVKAEENLLLQSQTFESGSWSSRKITRTANDATAPDGTVTAEKLLSNDATLDDHCLRQTTSQLVSSAYVLSVFAKDLDGTYLYLRNLAKGSSTSNIAVFDLAGGTVTFTGSDVAAATITAVTGGWYRCTLSITTTGTIATNFVDFGITTVNNNHVSTAGLTNGVYLWGAQLEQRSFATAYTATTTQPITNYQRLLKTAAANEWPREFDPVTGECLGRSVWEARTNLLLRSEEFDNASWTKTRASIVANQIIAPDGTLTADKLVENTDNNTHTLSQSATLTAVSNTISFYAKAGERSWVSVLNNTISNASAHFNLSSGVVGTVGSAATASIVSVGNGWYRCSMVFTGFAGSNQLLIRLGSADNTPSYTGDGYSGIYIWGAQLESGAFASPYTPTVAAQITRLADSAVMTGVNFSSWYRQDEGAFFVDATPFSTAVGNQALVDVHDGGGLNRVLLMRSANSLVTDVGLLVRVNNVNQAFLQSGAGVWPLATSGKFSAKYKIDDFAQSFAGGSPLTDTSGIIPLVDRMTIGNNVTALSPFNGYIKRLTYYPQALTSANLQAVTR